MANITSPRDAVRTLSVENQRFPVAASTKLIKGAMYGLNASGDAVSMATGVTASAMGEVLKTVDNTDGAAGDLFVEGRAGCFVLDILSSSALVQADVYGFPIVYFQDNHTVAKSSNSGARPKAGRLVDVRGDRAYVQVGPGAQVASPDGDLVAANNLSDVVSAATSRANIGANKGEFMCHLASLLAGTYYFPLPEGHAVTITRLASTINQALGGADLTITCSINTTAITTGVITATQSGSAAGDLDECAPSAQNVSDGANDTLRVVLAGNTTAGTGALLVEYTY
jgi:hypothetical protein